MAGKFPPLFRRGGPEAVADYVAEFDLLYRSGDVIDIWGRVVEFKRPGDGDCDHACTKDQPGDKRRMLPTVWNQERAERIRWIQTALTEPESIRPSHQEGLEHHEGYLVAGYAEHDTGPKWERFVVYVEPVGRRRGKYAKRVVFVTAYPIDQSYWNKAIQKGPCHYPEKPRR